MKHADLVHARQHKRVRELRQQERHAEKARRREERRALKQGEADAPDAPAAAQPEAESQN
jgi:hypothetical protein